MEVSTSTVNKLQLTAVEDLDPISIYLEDFEPLVRRDKSVSNAGKITIECFGKSWSAYWGGMGAKNVSEFFTGAEVCYLVNCLDRGISSTVNAEGEELQSALRASICEYRKSESYTKSEARALFDRVDDDVYDIHCDSDLFSDVIGCEWWTDFPQVENQKYVYLYLLVEAVQFGINQAAQSAMLKG